MREIRQSGSEGGGAEINRPSLPLSKHSPPRHRGPTEIRDCTLSVTAVLRFASHTLRHG